MMKNKKKYMKKKDYPNCPICGERCNFNEDGWYCPKCRDEEFMKDLMESEKEYESGDYKQFDNIGDLIKHLKK